MRHYDLTRFYAATKDLRATQLRAGHASPITTTIYADVVDMQEKADHTGLSGGAGGASPWKRPPNPGSKGGKHPPKGPIRL